MPKCTTNHKPWTMKSVMLHSANYKNHCFHCFSTTTTNVKPTHTQHSPEIDKLPLWRLLKTLANAIFSKFPTANVSKRIAKWRAIESTFMSFLQPGPIWGTKDAPWRSEDRANQKQLSKESSKNQDARATNDNFFTTEQVARARWQCWAKISG